MSPLEAYLFLLANQCFQLHKLFFQTSHYSKIMPAAFLLFRNYSHKIGRLFIFIIMPAYQVQAYHTSDIVQHHLRNTRPSPVHCSKHLRNNKNICYNQLQHDHLTVAGDLTASKYTLYVHLYSIQVCIVKCLSVMDHEISSCD